MRQIIISILLCIICFLAGALVTYNYYVPDLKIQIASLQEQLDQLNTVNIDNKETTTISYVAKTSKDDSDVEIKDKNTVSVSVNNQKYNLQPQVKETSKLENNKIVVEKEQYYNVDLTNTINTLAEEKAKKYKRIGKIDAGVLYNIREKDLYGGIRYNAKAFDIGYYHNISGNDWMIGLHYKF